MATVAAVVGRERCERHFAPGNLTLSFEETIVRAAART